MTAIHHDTAVSPRDFSGMRYACAFPVGCCTGDGSIVCVYRKGKEKHSRDGVLLSQVSTDGGRSWSDPVVVHDGMRGANPESVHAGGVTQLSDGRLVALFTAVEAREAEAYIFSEAGRQLEQKFYIASSVDGGRSWSAPRRHAIPNAPTLSYLNNRPVLLEDGSLCVLIEVTTETGRQAVMSSRYDPRADEFSPAKFAAVDPSGEISFGDPAVVMLEGGKLMMWLWAFTFKDEKTLNAHSCESLDGGNSWSTPQPTALWCQRAALHRQRDGMLLVAANVRVPPEGICLWGTRNNGEKWDAFEPTQLWDARRDRVLGIPLEAARNGGRDPSDGKLWASLPGFTFGSPDLVQDPHDGVVLLYYANEDGMARVRACRFSPELLPAAGTT